MLDGVSVADVAAMVGDPGRAEMLIALLDGRSMTATELATVARVAASTASAHLARLTEGGLLRRSANGRHRYFRLASREIAAMLENMLVVAGRASAAQPRSVSRIDPLLREARTCYDHLAGRLGVGLADALVAKGVVVLTAEAGEVTPDGRELLAAFGVSLDAPHKSRRLYCRPCLDWSERRPHIAGVLGAALLERCLTLGWVRRAIEGRAVTVTAKGRRGFAETFALDCIAIRNGLSE